MAERIKAALIQIPKLAINELDDFEKNVIKKKRIRKTTKFDR
jgi:hypothetical protein